jgi:hypothetical protein
LKNEVILEGFHYKKKGTKSINFYIVFSVFSH